MTWQPDPVRTGQQIRARDTRAEALAYSLLACLAREIGPDRLFHPAQDKGVAIRMHRALKLGLIGAAQADILQIRLDVPPGAFKDYPVPEEEPT